MTSPSPLSRELRVIGTCPRLFITRDGIEQLSSDISREYEQSGDFDRFFDRITELLRSTYGGLL